jgi:pSer/pThr/pTyr-binding forkhead associated (FHA) protein
VWILRSVDESAPCTIRLTPGAEKTVGRGPRADFMVDVALLSRVHSSLTATETGLSVEDLESTNGTFVNDQRVGRSPLNAGDRLRMGRLELTVSRT